MKNNRETEKRIKELLARMTFAEKLGQLRQMNLTAANADQAVALAKEGRLGSVVLTASAFAGNTTGTDIDRDAMTAVQNAACQSRIGIPVLFGKDVIHGYRTIFPIPLAQAATFDAGLVREAASRMAAEASRSGIQWTYAPMLDLARDPRWGRMIESFGEDPYLSALFGKASVEGIQGDDMSADDKIVACAKHFVGYGAAEGGRDYNKSEITDYTLRNMYFPAFRAAVDAGIGTFMNNFADIGGEPCVFSEYLFREVLRKEWGFDGFVVSDWGSICNQIAKGSAGDKREAALRAIHAGIDMEMVSTAYEEEMENLVRDGDVDISLIDEAVANILRVKMRSGLFEKPSLHLGELDIYRKEDMDFSLEIAKQCMVLLKNEDNVLPLKKGSRIYVGGPFADDTRTVLGNWCPGATDEKVHPFSACMKETFGDNVVSSPLDDYGYFMARHNADYAVLAVGESWRVSGEANSMASVELSAPQRELVRQMRKIAKKVILVVFAGRPLSLAEVEPYADAILYAWHPGTRGTDAAAAILAGEYNPSGRLPVSMLRSTGQIPTYYNHPKAQYHYREYRDELPTPLYPFGYGLSYTTFSYSDISVDRNVLSLADLDAGKAFTVTFTLENTGNFTGTEVAQLYVRDMVARKTRPDMELKGFVKTELKPGEKKTLSIQVTKDALGYYPEKTYVVEPGEFELMLGRDSEQVLSTLKIRVTG